MKIEDSKQQKFDIPGWVGYKITRDGRVWSERNHKWLKPNEANGRLFVNLYNRSIRPHSFSIDIHRLVLETFVGPRPPGMECRHLDGNPLNNNLNNLVWGTHYQNIQDRATHRGFMRGEKNPASKLSDKQATEIRKRVENGENVRLLVACFNVSNVTIRNVCRRKHYNAT